MEGKRFEDLEVGDKFTTFGRTVTETDIVHFVTMTGMTEELMLNVDYMEKHSIYRKRVAPGLLTVTFAEGLCVQAGLLHHTGMAFLGLSNMRMSAPLFCNDTIHVEIEVAEKRETRDPSRGVVKFSHTVRTQDDQTILVYEVTRMIRRRGH